MNGREHTSEGRDEARIRQAGAGQGSSAEFVVSPEIPSVLELHTLMTGIVFGESPRWGHDGRLWFSDWGAQELIAVDLAGKHEVIARVPSFPFCIAWLPDGRLLIVSASERLLLRREPDGSLMPYTTLSVLSNHPWNEIVADGRGNAYVNNIGFDFPEGEFAPGLIALVTPDGAVRQVADGLAFPNGMAVTPDNATLIVAESYGNRLTAFDIAADGSLSNRRVWADLGDGVPDGICLDADAAVWYADVPNKRCVRVHARGCGPEDAVPGGAGVGRHGGHRRGETNGPGTHRCGTRTRCRLAVDAARRIRGHHNMYGEELL